MHDNVTAWLGKNKRDRAAPHARPGLLVPAGLRTTWRHTAPPHQPSGHDTNPSPPVRLRRPPTPMIAILLAAAVSFAIGAVVQHRATSAVASLEMSPWRLTQSLVRRARWRYGKDTSSPIAWTSPAPAGASAEQEPSSHYEPYAPTTTSTSTENTTSTTNETGPTTPDTPTTDYQPPPDVPPAERHPIGFPPRFFPGTQTTSGWSPDHKQPGHNATPVTSWPIRSPSPSPSGPREPGPNTLESECSPDQWSRVAHQ